jgi:pimeloyl-ACP methyl ester carboxylesterase
VSRAAVAAGRTATETPAPVSKGVRRIELDAAGTVLCALLSEPARGAPRVTVVAVHGGGLRAGYFDGQAHPDVSLLALGARLRCTVLAVDCPGYGGSAPQLPAGLSPAAQSVLLRAALDDFTARHPAGAGLFLLGHSFGGKLVLRAAADGLPVLGLDISGCGHRPAAPLTDPRTHRGTAARTRYWGPLGLYPPGTFRACEALTAPVPSHEASELAHWPRHFARIAPLVRARPRTLWRWCAGWLPTVVAVSFVPTSCSSGTVARPVWARCS